MDNTELEGGASSPWRHALSFDTAVVRVPRAWDRVPKKSFTHKGRKVWKRPENKPNDADSDDEQNPRTRDAVSVAGAKRQRIKQMPAVPKVTKNRTRALPPPAQIPGTPQRKGAKRQSLRTTLLKKMASPQKQSTPRRRRSSQMSPTKSAGIAKAIADHNDKSYEEKENISTTGEASPVKEFTSRLSAVVLLPASESRGDSSSIGFGNGRGAEAESISDNASTEHNEGPLRRKSLKRSNDELEQAEDSLPDIAEPASRQASMQKRSSRRLSKRKSDIGPVILEKAAPGPRKRRSFGTGQSFSFDTSNLPSIQEMKADVEKIKTGPPPSIDTADGIEVPSELPDQDDEAEQNEEANSPFETKDDDNISTTEAPSRAFQEKAAIDEAMDGACDDESEPSDEAANEDVEETLESRDDLMTAEDEAVAYKEKRLSEGDEDQCIDLGVDQSTIPDDYLEEDELAGGAFTPLDDDATVPVGSPAYRANTAGSPPPELTALANALDDECLNDDQEFTQEVMTEAASPPAVDETVTENLAESSQELSQDFAPKRTRSGARFSDDTSILKEFLNRAHARKAAQALQPPPAAPINASPRRSPRKVLGNLDSNSPSPSKFTKPRVTVGERPGTPPGKKALPIEDTDDTLTIDLAAEHAPATRRSGRSRLPAPAKAPTPAVTSFIPVRRPDGSEPVILQRSQAQELASATRTNTRKNKGQARMPKVMLETNLKDPSNSPIKKSPTKKAARGRGKAVNWDQKLVYYQEELEAAAAASKREKPTARRSRAVGTTSSGTSTPKAKKTVTATPDAAKASGTPGPKRRGRSKV